MLFLIERLRACCLSRTSGGLPYAIRYILFIIIVGTFPIETVCNRHKVISHGIDHDYTTSPISHTFTTSIGCECPPEELHENLLVECVHFCKQFNWINSSDVVRDGILYKRDLNHVTNENINDENLVGESGVIAGNSTQPLSDYADTLLNYGRINDHINTNEYFIDHDGGYMESGTSAGGGNIATGETISPDTYTTSNCSDDGICEETNSTCLGDPIYCNYTYEEYAQMLYDYIYPTVPEWILIFSHSVVFFTGLVGNALVCIAVYTNYTMRTVTNIFIVNLAVADFFVILFCLPPTVVWDVTETWFLGETMCKVVLYFQTVSVTVSVLTLTFISLDRWYAICFPLRYVSTNGRAIGSIAFIWTLALVSDIPEFLYSTIRKKELRFDMNLFTQCIATWDKETEKNIYIGRFIGLYIAPLILMTVAYFQIVRVLWKSDTIPGHRESRTQTYTCGYLRSGLAANSSTMGQLRARRKAAKMLVAVVVMFAICYFPVHFLNILRYTIDIGQSEVIAVLSLFSHWLCYANSAVNPVIYNFMSGKFRREFRNALEKCRCGRIRVEDRSLYHNTPAMRINNISPSSRSNYQLTSVRDITSLRDRHTIQTSFVENGGGNGHNNHNSSLHHHHHHIHHPGNNQLSIDNRVQPKIDTGP